MEKLFSYLKRNITLAFKTVTFHFRQYLCFYIAVFIIQTLFGIIAMSASNNLHSEKKTVSDTYNYHICLSGLNKYQHDYLTRLQDPGYSASDYKGQVTPPIPTGTNKALTFVREESHGTGSDKFYDMYFMFEDDSGTSATKLYERYKYLYENDLKSLNGSTKYKTELSPLYTINERLNEIRANCALWLLLLGVVSVVVMVLLYNIRINHFKFTYGIYMSFGADSRKLFGTCFWEVMVIAWLTLIPSAIVSTVTDFLFFSLGGYEYRFSPYLMLYGLLFMIPIVLISVYIPVKSTAVKPPLKLLLAEDNSNLVTSPRISVQMLGKKFPSAYERLSFARFRKYNVQLVLSSVLFAALFVWTSFYCSIYNYSTSVKKPEFVVDFNQKKVESTETVSTKGAEITEFEILRRSLYPDDVNSRIRQKDSVASQFEKFYDDTQYTFVYDASSDMRTFVNGAGVDVTAEYNAAKDKALKGDYLASDLLKFESYFDSDKYIYEKTVNGIIDKVYAVEYKEVTTVQYVGPTYTEDMRDSLMSLGGITDVFKVSSTSAFEISSFVMFQPSDVRANSGFLVHPTEEKYTDVTMNVEYRSADLEMLNYISNNFTVVGDASDILVEEYGRQVVVSDSVNNNSVLKIRVGDTIKIARFKSFTKEPTAEDGLEGDKYLSYLLNYGEFEYEIYTVCAVIKDMASDNNMVMYFSDDYYESITGSEPKYKSISLYVDQSMSSDAVGYLDSDLRSWADKYDYTTVTWSNALSETKSELAMRKLPTFYTIAVMLLFISPLFWFFSQIMFYKKREKEFDLLRGMGAIESEIRKLFLFDGTLMALIGAVATALLSALGVFGMYRLTQTVLTMSATGADLKYYFEAPWLSAVIAVVVTALCGFISSYLPYVINRRDSEKKLSEEFGE